MIERPVMILKTINIICADCVQNLKSVKDVKRVARRLFLSVNPDETHIAMRLGAQICADGIFCMENEKHKFVKYIQTVKPGICDADMLTSKSPVLVKRK